MSFLHLQADPRWTGFLRRAPYLITTMFILSAVIFVMSCILGHQLHNDPKGINRAIVRRPTIAQVVFFEGTTSLVTIIYLATELLLHQIASAKPLVSLLLATLFLVGWAISVSFWMACDFGEFADGGQQDFCRYWPAITDGNVLTSPLQYARSFMSLFVIIGFVFLMGLASVAARRERKHEQSESYTDDVEMDGKQ